MTHLNRRLRHGERPTQPLDWNDKPDLLAMRAGVSEIQREIERARSAGLTMLALPIETANAACCYVVHLGERVGEKLNGGPAEQASKQVPTIDTAEFRQLLAELLDAAEAGEKANDPMLYKPARDRFIAHIDAQLAGQPAAPICCYGATRPDQECPCATCKAERVSQPAAPVAATEQARPSVLNLPTAIMNISRERDEASFPNITAHGYYMEGHREARHAAADLVLSRADELAALATPADAGAGSPHNLTDAEIDSITRHFKQADHHDSIRACVAFAVERLEQRLDHVMRDLNGPTHFGEPVLARLSTPAAPVTASQPAAQMPSIDTNNPLPPQEFIDYVARNYYGDVVFDKPEWHALRLWNAAMHALKGQPAAAHAAKSDGWISVDERLPDDDCRVLAATWEKMTKDQHIDIVSYRSGSRQFSEYPVTHWMPLPAAPIAAAHAAHDQKGGGNAGD